MLNPAVSRLWPYSPTSFLDNQSSIDYDEIVESQKTTKLRESLFQEISSGFKRRSRRRILIADTMYPVPTDRLAIPALIEAVRINAPNSQRMVSGGVLNSSCLPSNWS